MFCGSAGSAPTPDFPVVGDLATASGSKGFRGLGLRDLGFRVCRVLVVLRFRACGDSAAGFFSAIPFGGVLQSERVCICTEGLCVACKTLQSLFDSSFFIMWMIS